MALWSKKGKAEETPPPKVSNGASNGAAEAAPKPAPAAAPKPAAAAKPAVATAAPSQPGSADLQQGEAASTRLLFRLGEILSVMMRAPQFRTVPLGEVQALVLPPLMSGQYLVAEARSKTRGFISPVAVALWAKVSKEVDKRLSESLDKPIKLAPDDWKSGDIAWLIVLAGNPQAIAPVLKKFQETTLKGQPLKMRSRTKDGKTVVSTFQTRPAAA
jgi:hemolysin-activating ACP:hemolysin acyltransferase